MYITITVESEGKRFDLSIDERQSASAAYAILAERGLTGASESPVMYKSMLRGEWIPADKPLGEAGIVSGDFLTAQK
ncbi:MAG: EsaB/YukD family protein [Clostridiales Family XIII bacterium]|jgi:hypothetical protein|nr:EsaB/YukD family protein [Clostridiales Family XIII bacterium]